MARQMKLIAMEDPDLGHVSGVVAQQHFFAHKRGQRRIDVSQVKEPNAVRMDLARLVGTVSKQQVELLERVGHLRKKPALHPSGSEGALSLCCEA